MRRAACLIAVTALLCGCATSDRFSYGRQDPFIWFLSGMPAPYDLNYARDPVPDLPVLNPPEYTPAAPLQPLDYPRGWNPDHPPLMPPDAATPSAAPDASAGEAPEPANCGGVCEPLAPQGGAAGDRDARAGDTAREPVAQR